MLGAIIGDIIGSRFERHNTKSRNFVMFMPHVSRVTDDSVLTVAVADSIMNNIDINESLDEWSWRFPRVGYGHSYISWMHLEPSKKKPYYSFGNGAAMRVSSVGWLAKSEEEVKRLSKKVTEVTHNHPEALKAAEVVSMCVYYARKGKDKEFIKRYVEKYYSLNFCYRDLVENYTFDVSCQGSVPQAIFCFLLSKSFEDCVRIAVSIGGDSDTIAAISGGIAEAYYGIPDNMKKQAYKIIPKSMRKVLNQFNKRVAK
jgi:ADP-ribosylglycohydrolase